MTLYDSGKVVMSPSEPIEGRRIEKRWASCEMCSDPGKSDTIHHSGGLSHLEIDPKLTWGHWTTQTGKYLTNYLCLCLE